MEMLWLAAIILSTSIVESLVSYLVGEKKVRRKRVEGPLDDVTELRYSRLGVEYETI